MAEQRETIRDRDGKVISTSRNLRGIRRYVGSNVIRTMDISEVVGSRDTGAKLCILFENGASYETNFADFNVLKEFVRNWRNVKGAPLSINGEPAGTA